MNIEELALAGASLFMTLISFYYVLKKTEKKHE